MASIWLVRRGSATCAAQTAGTSQTRATRRRRLVDAAASSTFLLRPTFFLQQLGLHQLRQLRLQRIQFGQVVVDDVRLRRMQLQVVLMVVLGREERLQRYDGGRNPLLEHLGIVEL